MPSWKWDWWIFEWLGFVLIGAGLIAGALFFAGRRRPPGAIGETGISGNLPDGPGINIARVLLGGDLAGLLVVVGIFLAFLPMLWGWFLAVAAGAVLMAAALFLWHRYHPW
jgi:hypothetical protein